MASRQILLWAPRVLLIVFALFLIIFSFDVFGEGQRPTQVALKFVVHNIPSAMLGALVFVAWRREWIGASVCLLLAAAYIIWAWGRFPPFVYVVIAGPLAIVAVLYAVNWRLRSRNA